MIFGAVALWQAVGWQQRFFEKSGETVLKKTRLIAVVGATASGKSALAEALALRLGGEVVSCDSMQVYRGMDIGTAKPSTAERERVPYHLIDVVDPTVDFSMVDYVRAADAAIADISARGHLPILCGGTGLYLDAVLRGEPASPGGDAALRAELQHIAEERGGDALYQMLTEADPESAAAIHPANVRRVIRALEIYRATGVPKSEWDRKSREAPPRYEATVLGLCYGNRELLYRRIEERVDAMLEAGLVAETKRLLEAGVFAASRTASAAIGYKELLPYLMGDVTLEEAVAELKTATRRYAKRQITWFSAKDYVVPLPADDENGPLKFEQIVNNALMLLKQSNNML